MMKSILLPIDLNHESSWSMALPQAVALARADGAVIHALAVIPDYGMSMVGSFFPANFSDQARGETEVALASFLNEHMPQDVVSDSHVLHGTIYKEILSAAESVSADVIVMASHRPEMQDYLLGPNAARVVRHARCSVFVVRG